MLVTLSLKILFVYDNDVDVVVPDDMLCNVLYSAMDDDVDVAMDVKDMEC